MKRYLLTLLCAMAAFGAQASETAQATPKGDAARGKVIVSGVCVACHGADGNSPISANPKLAGQHPEYLLKQMKNFKGVGGQPPERVNAIMNGMIAAYDEGQMRDVAAYLSQQKQTPEVAKSAETIELGKKLYRGGDLAKGLPACAGCHGPTGAGMPAQYPRIAGQYADYLEVQLKGFRDGVRANDPNKMMRMVALKMTDAEMKAVSDYVAGLR